MDEQKNNFSSEVDLSDGWTVVNEDSEGNVNEVEETSDSESLEVLEVEQGDPEQNYAADHEAENCSENSCDEECTIKDCDDSFIPEDPLIHLAAVQKVRKYVHHPSAYINMWLSIVMVIAIAITLGLGIGHYVGSKRFARAKDTIHHLKYENQMLEQELADVTMKNKYCEYDLRSRVRQLAEGLNQFELPDSSYRRNYYLQDNIYGSSVYGHNDDVCYAEENPLISTLFKDRLLNETMPSFVQLFTLINMDGEQSLLHSFEDGLASNGSYVGINRKGDASFDVNSFPKVGEASHKILTTPSPFLLCNLSTRLTYMHSLLKKWHEFHENVKIQANTRKTKPRVRLQVTTHHPEVTSKVTPFVSGNCNKISCENVKHPTTISSNGFCRSKVNQCILCEEKAKNKERKCKALPKSQLFCSLVIRIKRKPSNTFLAGKQNALRNKIKRSETPEFAFEDDKKKLCEERKSTCERKAGNFHVKFRTRGEENDVQRLFKDHKVSSSVHKYSSDNKKMKKKKKSKLEKPSKFMRSKEDSHYKHSHFAKNQKIMENEKKDHQTRRTVEKQPFSHIHQQKQKHSKTVKKTQKPFKKHDSKDALNNKDKRRVIWDKQKYFDKPKSTEKTNGKISKDFKKHSKEKRFPPNTKKMNEDHRHSSHFKHGSSEYSYICKTKNNNKKNGSECAYLKYPLNVHQKDKNFQKYWKERSKMYQINIQEMKMIKS